MVVAGKKIKTRKQNKDVTDNEEDDKMDEDNKEENAKIKNLKSIADQIKERGEKYIRKEKKKKK
eukprot:11546792-Ditylum_brightwellii.AAC.1